MRKEIKLLRGTAFNKRRSIFNAPGCVGFAFIIFGCGFALIMSLSSDVICRRIESGWTDCEINRSVLYLFPINEQIVPAVEQAWVDRRCDEDCTYRVMLSSAAREVPISNMYSSGYDAKRQVADQINDYLANPGPEPLEIRASVLGGMSFLMAIPAILIIVGGIASARSILRLFRGGW